MELRSIMTARVVTVEVDDTLEVVKRIFDAMKFHHLLVVDSGKTLCGVISDRDLLRADITRAQDIRQRMPAIQKDCDQFEQSLYPASSGYSSVSAELSTLANKAGLQLESRSFQQNEIKGRNLEQVEVEAVVRGSYSGVVRFLNGLQRSNNVYAVEALQAKADEGQQAKRGEVRVSMHIKTYFRTT